jgi:hypothetical protein
MNHNEDDVFVWGAEQGTWCYRVESYQYVVGWGQPDQILTAESPEWANFMEQNA